MTEPLEPVTPSKPLQDATVDRYTVTSHAGITFDSREDVWPLTSKKSVNVGDLRKRVSPNLHQGLNATLCNLASRYSVHTVTTYVSAIRDYHRTMFSPRILNRWGVNDLRNYRGRLNADNRTDGLLGRLRKFLSRWAALRHPGVSADVVQALKAMSIKNGESGRVVRTRDLNLGPLTETELHNLTLDIYKAFEEGRITFEDLSLGIFHIITGRRTIQSAGLKCKDVDGYRKDDPEPGQKEGKRLLMLHVPRAKQVGHHFRETRRSIYLTLTYFTLFETQRDTVQAKFHRMLKEYGFHLQLEDLRFFSEEFPLYPDWRDVEDSLITAASLLEQGQHGRAFTELRVHVSGDMWHLTTPQIGKLIKRIAAQAGTLSRKGEPLNLTCKRLRYTRGSELARQGVGLVTLSWLLDHSTLETAGVYIDNLAEHAAQINAAMAGSTVLQHYASLFRGEVVDDEEHAFAGDDPHHSRVHYKGVGAATCGNRKQCGIGGGIPRACYTCDRFQPWLDGPHETVLKDLLAERKSEGELLASDHPVTLRRDKTIFAVINVIQRCEARRAELSRQASGDGRP